MKILGLIGLVILVGGGTIVLSGSSETAVDKLKKGNERFVSGKPIHPGQTSGRRDEVLSKQAPFAVIVSCSDSRVPPEIIFDQGIGDLFVVRVAGNIVGPIELDSIEYATNILHAPFVLVLGHQNCGAVSAVMAGKGVTDDIEAITPYILPAVEKAKKLPGDRLENTIKTNVELVIESLKKGPVLAKLIKEKKLDIQGGYYELNQGKVEFLNVH
jgi:carbonic anhydrase